MRLSLNPRRVAPVLLASLAALASAASPPASDELAARRDEVRRTELAFAASVMENRPADFAAYLDPEAVFVGGAGVTRGREAIVAAWSGFFAEGRPYFEWHPEIVELSADGSLGLTRGPWTLRATAADGTVREQSGQFNSVWRRQPDGSWRIVFDAGCNGCPKCDG